MVRRAGKFYTEAFKERVLTAYYNNRPLAKRNQIKITNSGDKVEAQTETFPSVTITFREDLESFDKAGGVFICHSHACDNPVFAH